MMRRPDTLIASAADGTLIVRQAVLHQATVRHFNGPGDTRGKVSVHEPRCDCGWVGKPRKRAATAQRDAERHDAEQPPQVVAVGRLADVLAA